MLIENYVEKYIPITIQEAITSNLGSFLNAQDQEQLDHYIKSRRKELHGVVLDNEEMPDVVNKINAIRQELGRIPYPNRQFPKDASNSDVQSSTFMQSNSMMSRGFFAFQGGRNKKKRSKQRVKNSHSNTDTTSMEGSKIGAKGIIQANSKHK